MQNMKFLKSYFKQRKLLFAIFLLFAVIFLCSFALYKISIGAILYPLLLCSFFGAVFLGFDYAKALNKHKKLMNIYEYAENYSDYFLPVKNIDDKDYQQIIALLLDEQEQRTTKMNIKYSDMVDYYTLWAHQIKTPIAAMKLNLQNCDTELSRQIAEDLFKIEQYVEMVLVFLRLDSDYTDYVFKEYQLDDIIKGAIKKFAVQFIRKKIKLEYSCVNYKAVTDEKWLSFIIEQVLSNSLKYTNSGEISIFFENEDTLCIKDTGIGIAPEDLPRIFDKGYTGYNGREDKKASGIGLYLCKRICANLGCTISADSVMGKGTEIRIEFCYEKPEVE